MSRGLFHPNLFKKSIPSAKATRNRQGKNHQERSHNHPMSWDLLTRRVRAIGTLEIQPVPARWPRPRWPGPPGQTMVNGPCRDKRRRLGWGKVNARSCALFFFHWFSLDVVNEPNIHATIHPYYLPKRFWWNMWIYDDICSIIPW